MSGHSKWHSIKHKKMAADAKRGRLFTRLIKEITVAARLGGGDAESNPRLRAAVSEARAANMPAENIKRAIMRGTGELPGTSYEEVTYEGYGPGGAAILVEAMTDNKNRTVAELRHIFSKYGGNLGETGCVSWMFQKKGYFVIEKSQIEEDALLGIALDAGAEDVREDDGNWEVIAPPEALEQIKQAFESNRLKPAVAEISMLPQSYIKLEGKAAQQMLSLMEALEDHEDVQKVYSNFDIEAKLLEAAS